MNEEIQSPAGTAPPEDADRRLGELVEQSDAAGLEALIEATPADALTHAVAALGEGDLCRLLGQLDAGVAAEVLELIPEPQAIAALESLPAPTAATIVRELPSDEQADLIGEVEDPEGILAHLDPEEAAGIRRLSEYEDETAGGIMGTEFLAMPNDATVADVVRRLRVEADEHRDYDVQYVYVVDRGRVLRGVLRLRDLLLTPGNRPVEGIMIRDPLSVPVGATLADLRTFFDERAFLAVPVVDRRSRLVGVVLRSAVDEALAERSEEDYRRAQGIVGGEELRSMPLLLRSRRRLAWLALNIVLNVVAASVIAAHQDTLQAVIALAVFLPIISDMSGCSGNQAVAVSMRELSLNVARPDDAPRVLVKELQVGVLNGLVLGLLLGVAAWLWKGNPWLGLVVGAAISANTLVAVAIGGTIPLALKALRLDPALASGPILTTVTDLCGFLVLLSLSSMLLHHLV